MDELSAQIRNCMYQYSRAIYRKIKDLIDPYADPDEQPHHLMSRLGCVSCGRSTRSAAAGAE